MVLESKNGQMVMFMMEIGNKTILMVRVGWYIKIKIYMKENGNKELNRAKENIFMKMALPTMECGKMINKMGKESKNGQTVQYSKGYTKTDKKMDMEN